MIVCSIDIETTGLDPERCQTIEFAAVLDDLSNPKPLAELQTFHCYVVHPFYCGEPYALALHQKIFQRIASKAGGYQYLPQTGAAIMDNFCFIFHKWLEIQLGANYRINIAGKNFAVFDLAFLKKCSGWSYVKANRRYIDPAVKFALPTDPAMPDMSTCLKRAGFDDVVAHEALDDAMQVIRLVRKGFNLPV